MKNLFLCSYFSHTDLVHLFTSHKEGAEKDLQPFFDTFLKHDDNNTGDDDDTKPTILYSAYFEIPSSVKGHDYLSHQNGPIYTCCGTFLELDYDESIRQSRLLYSKMYPDEEFLPKAPEPEEIIIGDEDANSSVNIGVLADLITENTKNIPENTEVDTNAESIVKNTAESDAKTEIEEKITTL